MIQTKKMPPKKAATIDINIAEKNIKQAIAIPTGKFLGVNNDIICSHSYVDSHGDIVKFGILENGTRIVEFDLCENSIEQSENAAMYNTNEENSSSVRKPRIKIEGNTTELAEISLGNWRNTISKIEGIDNLIIGIRTYYDKTTLLRKDKDNGNTTFKTILACNTDNIEAATKLLNDIFKKYSKVAVEWL